MRAGSRRIAVIFSDSSGRNMVAALAGKCFYPLNRFRFPGQDKYSAGGDCNKQKNKSFGRVYYGYYWDWLKKYWYLEAGSIVIAAGFLVLLIRHDENIFPA